MKTLLRCPYGHDAGFAFETVKRPFQDDGEQIDHITCLACGRVYEHITRTERMVDWVNQFIVAQSSWSMGFRELNTETARRENPHIPSGTMLKGQPLGVERITFWSGQELEFVTVEE